MNTTLQIIEFFRSSEDVLYDYRNLSDNDMEKILNLDIQSMIDFGDENGNYTFCILILPSELEKYKKILDDNIIPYICTNISQNVIKNNINMEKKLLKYNCDENKYNRFIEKVNEWITSNLDLDIILDMVNEKGINSLRKVDKEFLEKI